MTKKGFAPKGADEIRQEVLEDLGVEENEDNKEIIDRLVNRRLKDEEFKSSLHKSKAKYKELAKQNEKGKGDKKTQKSIQKPNGEKSVSQLVKEELFKEKHGATALHNLKKVMRGTGKDFDEAQNDATFTSFMSGRESEAKRRAGQLGASKGGGKKHTTITPEQRKMAEAMGNDPEEVYKN